MNRRWLALFALLCVPQLSAAQSKAKPSQRPQSVAGQPARDDAQQPGMVVTGDREAPLVLHIVPWQEPKPVPPRDVQLQSLIPQVFEYAPSVLDAPENRPLPRPAAATR